MWNPSNRVRHSVALFVVFGLLPAIWFLSHIYWILLVEAAWKTPSRISWNWTAVVFAIGGSILVGILTFFVFRGNPDYMKTWKLTVAIAILAGFAMWLGLFVYSIVLEKSRINEEYESILSPCQMTSLPKKNQRDPCKVAKVPDIAGEKIPKLSLTTHKDLNRELVRQAREIAKKSKSIHDQLDLDLKEVRKSTEWDVEKSRMDLQGQERDRHDDMVRRAHRPEEMGVRENAENQYIKCCEKAAVSLRVELMLKCPGVVGQDNLVHFTGEYDGHKVQRNLPSYSKIGDELNSLANALENGNCRYK